MTTIDTPEKIGTDPTAHEMGSPEWVAILFVRNWVHPFASWESAAAELAKLLRSRESAGYKRGLERAGKAAHELEAWYPDDCGDTHINACRAIASRIAALATEEG